MKNFVCYFALSPSFIRTMKRRRRRRKASVARVPRREDNIKMDSVNTALKTQIPGFSFARQFPGRFMCSECDAVSLVMFGMAFRRKVLCLSLKGEE